MNDPATNDTAVHVRANTDGTYCNDIYSIWLVQPSGYGSQYTEVRSYAYYRCLDADNKSGRLTGIVHLYTCNSSPNQAWDFLGGTAYGRLCAAAACYCRQVVGFREGGTIGGFYIRPARMDDPRDDSEYDYPQQRWYLKPVPLG